MQIIKDSKMGLRWAGHVARTGTDKNRYETFLELFEKYIQLEKQESIKRITSGLISDG
jgi:hypothetical protein